MSFLCGSHISIAQRICFLWICLETILVVENRIMSGYSRVEKGSNTSTVTLRVVGGDEKGSLKSETVKYGRKCQGTRTRERLCRQGPAAYKRRQTRPLVREGAPTKTRPELSNTSGHEPQMGLDTKTYWLTEHQSQYDFDFEFGS
jgi:hypothetical protein